MFPFFSSRMEITLHCWKHAFMVVLLLNHHEKCIKDSSTKPLFIFSKLKMYKNNSSTTSNAKTQTNKALTKTTQIDIFFPPQTRFYSISKSWCVFLQLQNPHTSHLLPFPGTSRGAELKLRRNSPPCSPYPYSQGSLEEMPPAHVED